MADQGTEGILSPFLRRQRMAAAKPYLRGNTLDVGCGTGLLAREIHPDHYVGVEIDSSVRKSAGTRYPNHRFQEVLPDIGEKFVTVVALAVIEHVKDPRHFMMELSDRLDPDKTARIVITTPHPSLDWIHDLGASAGLFSKHASEEHEELLGREDLSRAGVSTGLQLVAYRKFLFGANQLAVFGRPL